MKIYRASALLIAIMTLAGVSLIMFMAKDLLFAEENNTQGYQQHYLNSKFTLSNLSHNENEQCREQKKSSVIHTLGNMTYSFHCELFSLFPNGVPTKKYVEFEQLSQVLNLAILTTPPISIKQFDELPPSSYQNPQIIIAEQALSGKLEQEFHGIIITDYPFEMSAGKSFYGVLYSSYPNNPNRYLSFKREVVERLYELNAYWNYLPHSRNILANEKP